FQAEDGIRDGHVTGVQTCALPISSAAPPLGPVVPGGGAADGPARGAGALLPDRDRLASGREGGARGGAAPGVGADPAVARGGEQIGRASCRERVWRVGV